MVCLPVCFAGGLSHSMICNWLSRVCGEGFNGIFVPKYVLQLVYPPVCFIIYIPIVC